MLRYWDGTRWTDARKPAGEGRPWFILALVVFLVVCAVVAALLLSLDHCAWTGSCDV